MKKTITFLSRRAAVMLLATLLLTLTAQTAWAAGDIYVGYLDPTAPIGQQRKTVLNPVWVDETTTEMGTAGETTWYLVSGTITNDTRIEVKGTVNLILTDGCNFTVSKGIHVPSSSALNIYAQSVANRGSLTANNDALPNNYAAIGGNGGEDAWGATAKKGENAGDITIYGGNITITNGNIGGGDGGNGNAWTDIYFDEEGREYSNDFAGNGGNGGDGNVTIYSGYVWVKSGNIGGGKAGTGEDSVSGDSGVDGNNGDGNVNLSWANTSDRIYADNYYGTVTLQKAFYRIEDADIIDAGVVNNNDLLNGKNLIYAGDSYTVTIGSLPDGVTATADLELSAGGKTAVVGQVVTISFSGVPDGKVPVVSVTYGNNNDNVNDIIDNGDGTFSFVMPNGNATVTASDLIEKIPYIDADGNTAYCTNFTVLNNTMTTISAGWYVVNSDITYTGTVTLNGDTHLILCDGAEMSVDGSGISLECNGALTIYGQSGGTGTLTLKSNQTTISVIGNLTICSGSVSATSSGDDVINTTGDIILKGGTLTACADDGTSRAIRCSGTLNLSGGKVVATKGAIYAENGATIASGLAYTDGSTAYTTSISSNDLEALGAVTLELADDGTPEEEVLSLTDNEAYTQQSQIDGVDVYYTRDFSKYWEAIYLPFSLKYEDWKDDFEVARINAVHQYDTNDDGDIDKTELEFVKMTDDESVIEPNTPYLIKAKTSGEKTLSVENTTVYEAEKKSVECSTTTEKFIFTGNYETIPYETLIAKKYYAMGGGELVMSNGSDLGPYRWYMERENRNSVYGINNNSANAKEISINVVGEETTGIADIQHPSPDTPTYDLNGRRVNENNLKPGIYVKNGKKFVVK